MKTIKLDKTLKLESGAEIKHPIIAYSTYGELNEAKDNVIWVCHALTGNSEVHEWWSGILGADLPLDPEKHFIVCANVIGSCYGSTGPLSYDENGDRYFTDFPLVTPRDMATLHNELRLFLGIQRLYLLIGPSLGGQQALEWSISEPEVVENLVLVATNAKHSPFGIAFNEAQRLAIYADSTYREHNLDGGKEGLKAARAIGMLSYRSYDGYNKTQSEENEDKTDDFKASSYQRYQGEKLAKRFDAYSYVTLSKAMDAHNVGRNRYSVETALSLVKAKTLVIGVSSDLLFPVSEQQFLAEHIPNATYAEIHSDFGHDGFLVEFEQLRSTLHNFLNGTLRTNALTRFKTTLNLLSSIL
jgi:homoserine O-acetyltransferase/O-succinyltransferase